MKSLGVVGLEKNIFLFFPMTSPGRGLFGTVGRIAGFIQGHYTLLHAKKESSGPCGFGEEDCFMFLQL